MKIEKIFEFFESNEKRFVEELKSWIAIKSVSSCHSSRIECFKMIVLVSEILKKEGCQINVVPNPLKTQKLPDGTLVDLPPILLASYEVDPKLKTVCVYGHLDVQPAKKSDGWSTEPFEMVIKGDEMIGRGTSDDKGPVLGWICVLRAYNQLGIKPNINIKLIFECMEEVGSDGLFELLIDQKDKFLQNVDFICISDNSWLGTKKPSISYGLRGVVYLYIEISGPKKDLHSGIFGGTIKEPMNDLVNILAKLVDQNGHILIDNIYDTVQPFTETEKKSYETIEFEPELYLKVAQCEMKNLTCTSKVDILTKRWRYPSLSIHGIEGAFSDNGFKTVIPSKVIGKISIRIVPNMVLEEVEDLVRKYISKLQKELCIQNNITIRSGGADPWFSDINHPNYRAAITATQKVYHVEPDMTREGGSVPITNAFQKILKKNVVLIPMGRADDGPHSQNEKLNISNFINGMKIFYSYIDELGKI